MYKQREYSFRGNSYKVAYVDPYAYHASWFTHEDEATVRDVQWDIKSGDAVIDVGAAYGSYALAALACGAKYVWAWSPQGEPGFPMEHEFFQESLRLNGWEDKCHIYKSGVYDKSGWLDTRTQVLVQEPPNHVNHDVIRVDPLDEWYEDFINFHDPRLFNEYWLKLDVEGAEVEVLKSAKNFITQMRPKIQVEMHLFKRHSIGEEVRTLLSDFGYDEVSSAPYHSVVHSLFLNRKKHKHIIEKQHHE